VLIFLGKYTCNRDRCAFREEMFSGVMLAWRVLLWVKQLQQSNLKQAS